MSFQIIRLATINAWNAVTIMSKHPKEFEKSLSETKAIVDGAFFTRNLINEPAKYFKHS